MSAIGAFPGLSGRHFVVEPEQALLFLAANVHAHHAGDTRLRRALALPLRWDRVLALSHAHGVTALVRHVLRSSGYWNMAPEQARQALDAWHHSTRITHLLLARQLATILAELEAASIDPIILKGAALAPTAYPDPALRPMVDIDFLVKPEEIETTAGIMERLGYVRDELYYSDAFNRVRGYHLLFIHPAGDRLAVEVHWRLASVIEQRNTLTAATLQDRTVRARVVSAPGVAARDARILAPEAQLVYLATHAAKERHSFSDLKLLGDIAAIAGGSQPLAWSSVCRLARQVQARSATYVALALSRDLLGAAVPSDVLAQLRPPRALLRTVERTLNPATILDPVAADRRTAVKYLVVDSPAVTARLLLEHVLPPADALREYYPERRERSLALVYPWHVVMLSVAAARKAALWLRR